MPSESTQSWRERRTELRKKREKEHAGYGENGGTDDLNLLVLNSESHNEKRLTSGEKYIPHISAAKRIRIEQDSILSKAGGLVENAKARKLLSDRNVIQRNDDDDDSEEGHDVTSENENKSSSDDNENHESAVKSLLEQATKINQNLTQEERKKIANQEEEARILKEASKVQTNALKAASELAHGVTYSKSLPTTWTVPRCILNEGEAEWHKIRSNWHIIVEGDDIPPPIKLFRDMKLPAPILNLLEQRNIRRPTPIQMQGLPVALAGRDMVGIAFTGSGKTMTFSLPLVMAALEEEIRMPLVGGEGPVGVILAPSRELVRQTYELVEQLCDALSKHKVGNELIYPRLRCQLVIGGENSKDQLQKFRDEGVHCVVASPGRLRDFLKKKSINLDICRYICLDEADRMLDLGFDEEVGEIMNHFKHQRQTLLFSATFPKKFQDFAKQTLVQPIVVNVGRAGAANLDVIQEVEYVKQEAKIVYLLECLQKTAPPVIIFCERKGDVDDIHEYLLLKGVETVSIHGGKEQAERNEAIRLFKEGKADVLIATDVAAKGLDFADIQHVINFDMPSEIENYVHRIGRTGRCGKTGVATTFINKSCEETTLLDLKHLLKEAHQRIPPVLMIMDDPLEDVQREDGSKGCSFCGGLGHSIVDCPKIDKDARRVTRKDALASGDGYGGDW
jgi:ATP-dependent RNA helicase DDX41